MIYNADWLIAHGNEVQANVGGKYVAARGLSGAFLFEKTKAAWEVFRGRADALKWTGQENVK